MAHYPRMKNASAELVSCIVLFLHIHAHVRTSSVQRKSLSPVSMQRFKDQLETDIDALSSRSSDPEEPEIFDLEGKTPAEIAAWCTEYKRGKRCNRRLMAQRRRMGIAGICQGFSYIIIVY